MGLLYSHSHYEANPITNNSISINAVSGTLSKTFKKSFFQTFEFGSRQSDTVFDENNPRISYWEKFNGEWYEKEKKAIPIVVLQTMLCGNNRVLVELIRKEDYEEMFKGDENNA